VRELVSVVTRKGQITIPAEIRRALGLKKGDKVAFVMEAGQVRLKPTASIVERTAGMFASQRPPETAEQLRQAAERAISQEAIERMDT